MTLMNPASRRRTSASATPDRISSSSIESGGKGLPRRTIALLMTPSRSRKTARFTRYAVLPLGGDLLQGRMRHQAVPDDRLERLGVRRYARRVHRGNHHYTIANL